MLPWSKVATLAWYPTGLLNARSHKTLYVTLYVCPLATVPQAMLPALEVQA